MTVWFLCGLWILLVGKQQSFRITTSSLLTLYTLTSVCIFSILFSIHSLWCWQREFVCQLRASLFGDHFFCSCGLYVFIQGLYHHSYNCRCYTLIGGEGLTLLLLSDLKVDRDWLWLMLYVLLIWFYQLCWLSQLATVSWCFKC